MRMRADKKVQESSIKMTFIRNLKELEEQDCIRSDNNYIRFVHDEDRQDK